MYYWPWVCFPWPVNIIQTYQSASCIVKLFSYIFLTSTILIAYSLISNAFWYPLFEKQLSSPEKWLGNTPKKAAYLFLLRTIHLYINESPPLPHDLPVPKLPWLRYLTKLYTVYSQYKSPFFHTVVTVVLLLTVQWPCSSWWRIQTMWKTLCWLYLHSHALFQHTTTYSGRTGGNGIFWKEW